MSKLHRDNAGYVGCSYEETQDPFYSYNKLSLPLSQSDKTVVRDEVTFTVTVAGGKFVIDGTSQATVSLLEGNVYTFDQSDSSNSSHPLKFSYTADGTHGGGLEYTLGVTTNGTPGQSGAYTKIIVPFGLHDLKYYCGNHSGMGGSANVSENTKAFTSARPILETSNAYGESGFTNSAVLKVGDPTSSTDNPFGTGNGHSVDFDGNDALRIAGGSIGTGDWTIEFWVKSSSYGLERMVSARQMTYSSERTNLRSYNGQWEFYAGDNPDTQSYSGTNISTNTWVHAAVVRSGTTISYYAAGSRLDTDTIDANATTTLTEVDVAHGYGSEYFTGKISNVRVSDTARYSGTSYTVPSAGFTSDANTLLLAAHTSDVSTVAGTWSSGGMSGTALPGEDPFAANLVLAISGKNGFQDVSATIKGSGTNKAVTANGNATTSSSEGRYYGGGSLQLDGSGDYFTIPNSSDFAFGTGDYTVEFWIKTTDTAFNILDIDTGGGWSTVVVNNNAPLFWQTNRANSNLYQINTNSDLIDGNWHHVAYVRKDGVHTPFLDGKPIGNVGGYLDLTNYTTSTGNLQIGRGANGDLNGYLQDIRIYKGVAKYTTPFPTGSYGMNAITFTGNGKQQAIGGTKFSDFVTGTQFGTGYSKERAFNEDLDDRTFASVGTGNLVFTPPDPIPVTTANGLRLRIKADSTNNTGVLLVNGTDYSSSISSGSNWMTFNVSSLVSIEFGTSVGNGSEQSSLAAIEIDGSILIDGTSSKFNFQPDLVWTSVRDATGYIKYIFDSIRGATKALATSHTQGDDAETTLATSLTSFDSSGFSIGDNSQVNENNRSMVAWGWKAGGAPTTDNVAGAGNVPTAGSAKIDGENMTTSLAGTIPATRLTASTKYGFSIVAWEGNGTSGQTVAHGITNATPKMVWFKNRDTATTDWRVYNTMVDGSLDFMFLNTDGSKQDSGLTTFTSTTFTVGSSNESNGNNDSMIAYVWSEVSGYSSLSSYEGTGNAGVSVTTGFKPRWVMIKEADNAGNWFIYDTQRTTTKILWANTNQSESSIGAGDGTNQNAIEVNDSGFTIPHTLTGTNRNGSTYIYAAFAESPAGEGFVSSMVSQIGIDDLSGNSNNASNKSATWQTAVKKFYGGAMATNTKHQVLEVTSDDFNVGSGDFTLEFWVYSTSSAQEGGVWPRFISTGQNATTSIQVGHIGSSTGRIRYTHSDNSQYAFSPDTDFRNQWVHVAVVRLAGVVSVYCNGSRGQTFSDANAKTSTSMYISGYQSNNGAMTGYMQDVKWYKHLAKYTSSFSPPERSVQGTARRYPSGVYVVS